MNVASVRSMLTGGGAGMAGSGAQLAGQVGQMMGGLGGVMNTLVSTLRNGGAPPANCLRRAAASGSAFVK